MPDRLPDFVYAGTGKAGTTWLFERLREHPTVHVTEVKETNYFDLNYDRGVDWYRRFFEGSDGAQAVGEVAHRYLRTPQTARRILDTLGPVKIVVGLREPVDYALSDYLFARRNGMTNAPFDIYLRDGFDWEAIEYQTLIRPFAKVFGVDGIHICDFARLDRDPQGYLDDLTDFLGADRMILAGAQTAKVNKARAARSRGVAAAVSRGAKWLKRRGGQRIIQAVKSNPLVQRVLYRDLDVKPQVSAAQRQQIEAHTRGQIAWLDATFGTDLLGSWYGTGSNQ